MAIDSWTQIKEQIRQAVDIVDLVGGYVPLRRQGSRYVGLCPWHDDSRPSLQVNPDRQSFRCYVCDIGGDVFSFVMEMEKIGFREALAMLADRVGIALPAAGRDANSAASQGDDRRTLLQAMAWAEEVFHGCLVGAPEAQAARDYLRARGISDESIRLFRLGYSPPRWDWLLGQARATRWTPRTLERIGLVVPRPNGHGHYDRFRGRVLFPIRDVQSRPIALGGRILPQDAAESPAKYINSPETPLFSKSEHLYGLNIARERLAKERSVVVMEGYTDCVIAHQCGFSNVVAVLGTALGERQIRLLCRFADSITLTLDGDEAGRRRAGEILELFVAMQVDLRILVLPENHDPCDFLRAHGGEAFGRLLADAVDALEYKIRMATQGLDPSVDTHRAHAALEEILRTLAGAPRLAGISSASAALRQQQIVARLARRFQVDEDSMRARIKELRARGRKPPARIRVDGPAAATGPIDAWDEQVLELVLRQPDYLPKIRAEVVPESLRSAACKTIYTMCLRLADAGRRPDYDTLMLELEDPVLRRLLARLDEGWRAKAESNVQLQLDQTLESYRHRKEDTEYRRRIAALRDQPSEADQVETLNRLIATLKPRHRRSDPTDG